MRQLRDEGFDADIAEIDTGRDRVERNGEQLGARSSTRIIARPGSITHSKGGLDFLHALVERSRARRFVDGWIAFQAPFMGLARRRRRFAAARARGRISGAALQADWRATWTAIDDLRTDRRAALYGRTHAREIAQVSREIPVMCVATTSGKRIDQVAGGRIGRRGAGWMGWNSRTTGWCR